MNTSRHHVKKRKISKNVFSDDPNKRYKTQLRQMNKSLIHLQGSLFITPLNMKRLVGIKTSIIMAFFSITVVLLKNIPVVFLRP